MKYKELLFIFALLLATASCSPEIGHPSIAEDEAALRALAEKALTAENNEDLETWLTTITEDAIILGSGGPLRGKQAIREDMEPAFSEYDWEISWSLQEIDISGDLAVMWGPLEMTTTARKSGELSHSVGYHMDVARRQPDGSWQFTWWTTMTRSEAASGNE